MSHSPAPIMAKVYDESFGFCGDVKAFTEISAVPRHMAVSTAEFVMDSDHVRTGDLLTDGARVKLFYKGDFLMSGLVTSKEFDLPWEQGKVTFGVESDFAILSRVLGWPNPSGAITAQGAESAYYELTDDAETVLKTVVTANATRLGIPLTCATNLGRGDTITVAWRMHPIADKVIAAVDQAGLGIDIRQVGAGWVLDVYEPTVRDRLLTEESGVIVGGKIRKSMMAVSRVVVGGAGEGTARGFVQRVNTAAESAWGVKIEGFRDARDIGGDYKAAVDDIPVKLAERQEAGRLRNALARELADRDRAKRRALILYQRSVGTAQETAAANERDAADDAYDTSLADYAAADTAYDVAYNAHVGAVALEVTLRGPYLAELEARGDETLAEGDVTVALNLELIETETFRYPVTLAVGDSVPVKAGPIETTEIVREVPISWTESEGLVVTATVGSGEPTPDHQMAKAISALAKGLRDQRAGR